MSQVAILARVTVKAGRAGEYLAALAPLIEQARKIQGVRGVRNLLHLPRTEAA